MPSDPSPNTQQRSEIEARIRKMVKRWPDVSGYHLNPDEIVVKGVTNALVNSAMAHGFNYCP
jgi:ferredoxin-thioredoxin reductase catalytic subunit